MPERRLHPAGIAIYGVQALGNAIFPLVVVLGITLLGGRGSNVTGSLIWGARVHRHRPRLRLREVGDDVLQRRRAGDPPPPGDRQGGADRRAAGARGGARRPSGRAAAALRRAVGARADRRRRQGRRGRRCRPSARTTVRELRARVGVPEPAALDPQRRLRLGPGGAARDGAHGRPARDRRPGAGGAASRCVQQVLEDEGSRSAVDALPDSDARVGAARADRDRRRVGG